MTTDLVRQDTAYGRASLEERQRYVSALAQAGDLLPKDLLTFAPVGPNNQMVKVGDRGKVMLMTETGDMLGIHPMAALAGVHIIEGRPSISANLMGGLVRKAGHKLRVQTTGSASDDSLTATAILIREDDPDFEFVVTWNVEKAKRAGLWPGKDSSNWRKYPDAMMKARAISEVIREGAPDVLMGGNIYTPEELGAVVDEQGEPVELTQVQPDVSRETSRPESPIVDTPPVPQGGADEFDWVKAIEDATSSVEMGALYQRARKTGMLTAVIEIEGVDRELGQVIIEVGKAFSEAEAAADAAYAGDGTEEAEVMVEGEPDAD